jgi:hypothetical protein
MTIKSSPSVIELDTKAYVFYSAFNNHLL